MDETPTKAWTSRYMFLAVSVVVTATTYIGCTTSPYPAASHGEDALTNDITLVTTEFDQALQQLDHMLADRGVTAGFPLELLAEAQELRNAAQQLFFEDEIDLALEFLNEAIALLRDPR